MRHRAVILTALLGMAAATAIAEPYSILGMLRTTAPAQDRQTVIQAIRRFCNDSGDLDPDSIGKAYYVANTNVKVWYVQIPIANVKRLTNDVSHLTETNITAWFSTRLSSTNIFRVKECSKRGEWLSKLRAEGFEPVP